MKIRIKAHAIEDADITHISLVKRGANRSPFKIVKTDGESLFAFNLRKAEEAMMNITSKLKTLKKSVPPGGNYQPPQTRGEQENDTETQAAERARVASQRALERRIVLLQDEFRLLQAKPGIDEYARYRVLNELHNEINGLRRALADFDPTDPTNPTVAKADALDLLCDHGVATNFVQRGGSSHRLEADPNPTSRISKAEQEAHAHFWRELAMETAGIRRPTAETLKKASETNLDDLSNSIGLRGPR